MLNNEYVGLIERKEEILSIKESEFIFQGIFYDNSRAFFLSFCICD
jgi:hypothetical protein